LILEKSQIYNVQEKINLLVLEREIKTFSLKNTPKRTLSFEESLGVFNLNFPEGMKN